MQKNKEVANLKKIVIMTSHFLSNQKNIFLKFILIQR